MCDTLAKNLSLFCLRPENMREFEWKKDGGLVHLPESISGKENVKTDAEQAAVIVGDQHHSRETCQAMGH